ncbi:MAG: PilZ domain-containing protein [Candidatus Omnitrophica bacterium]|nr:PilZ domain-containing protein [Candidatus Omnitrophota bacterium]
MRDDPVQERRCHERFPVYCPLEYKGEDFLPKEPSVTLNVSEGGALISAKRELPVDSNIILKFKFQDELFFIIGKVKHIRAADGEESYEVGIQFWDKPKAFTRKFIEELEGIKEYRRRCSVARGFEVSLAEASMEWYKDNF